MRTGADLVSVLPSNVGELCHPNGGEITTKGRVTRTDGASILEPKERPTAVD
jgi:hypothetical protein